MNIASSIQLDGVNDLFQARVEATADDHDPIDIHVSKPVALRMVDEIVRTALEARPDFPKIDKLIARWGRNVAAAREPAE